MRVLVATKETQGKRPNDFCFCEEWELVKDGMYDCDSEVDLPQEELKERLRTCLGQEGWLKPGEAVPDREWKGFQSLMRVAAALPLGTIVERRERIQRRSPWTLGR